MNSVINQQFLLQSAFSDEDINAVEQARSELFDNMNEGYPIYLSSETDQELERIKQIADEISSNFEDLVVIATGASNTIPHSIACLRTDNVINIHYLDNADASTFAKLLNKLNPDKTAFLAISKSGETVEILALTLLCLKWSNNKHLYVIANPGENSLRKIASSINASILDHPKEVGGRYAVFSSVGLLVAAIVGFDINAIIEHAKSAFTEQIKPNSWVCQGVTYLISMAKLYSNSVFMIYGDQFNGLNNWHRQLIAESLGRNQQGINPMIAAGLIDQHSQLQLYLDGPNDKFYTFLCQEPNDSFKISAQDFPTLKFLDEKTLADIMEAQFKAVKDLLIEKKRNLRIIKTQRLNEQFIAEFMLGQMLEVILYAYTQSINPFGQPAVEKIKQSIKHYLTHRT